MGLEDQVEAMRRRHGTDPTFELLRAANADALPTELQEAVWMSSAGIQSFRFGEPLALPLPRLTRPPAWVMMRRVGTFNSSRPSRRSIW